MSTEIKSRWDTSILTTISDHPSERTSLGDDSEQITLLLENNSTSTFGYVIWLFLEIDDFGLTKNEIENVVLEAHCTSSAIISQYDRETALSILQQVNSINAKCNERLVIRMR